MSGPDPATHPLLRVHEAAAFLGVCPNTLWKWIARGLIQKIPDSNFITRLELDRFLEEHSRPRTPEERRRGPYRVNGRKPE